jgi:transcriptional regulator GlxA family with amidase domain
MIDREPNAGSHGGAGVLIPEEISDSYRERVVGRRRRSSRHRHNRQWVARSRRRYLRTFVVCTGVLLLMAVGLYFGLAHQEVAPTDGSLRAPAPVVALAG